jgi:S1-C subfamily serine protease
MSEQSGHGTVGAPSAPGHGFSAITGSPPQANGDSQRTSDFGRFDWFAESEDFGLSARQADGRAADGQVADAQQAGDQAVDRDRGARRGWWRPSHGRPSYWRPSYWRLSRESTVRQREGWRGRWLRGWRLAVTVTALVVACTLLGGVVGGYVALRGQGVQSDRSYSLGPVPPALTDRPASSVAGIAARDTPAVVMIKVDGDQGTGSGFLIKGGYIVTDNHVVTLDGLVRGAALRVYFSNGKSARGLLVGRDPFSDIAVVKAVGVTNLPALTLGNSAAVQVGDPVIAIGSPLGLADTVTSGIVSAVQRPVQPGSSATGTPQVFFDAIQTDAPINPGNSGGPLVNARGQVIGIDAAIDTLGADPITGTQGGSIGLGFAIPMDQARRVVVQLIRSGQATHSVIGAGINANFSGNGAQLEGHVTPGGPAAQAGLRVGDVVIKLGSQPIPNAYSLLDAVRSLAPGSRVVATFIRHGQTQRADLTLGSAPS